ncbi:Vacuolar protein sorting-associated protein 53 [Malassezia yamatoensis]|uniref:Vacuolar protein sorting-associated protein 53 n=1 Tax=Malassezia yamatoensis TaxID=253288 RepID=A0AAJ6CIE3_9BASI|nr:Vacuolar protein sorting-associated protein 53 [Malassezia yamatoensis]
MAEISDKVNARLVGKSGGIVQAGDLEDVLQTVRQELHQNQEQSKALQLQVEKGALHDASSRTNELNTLLDAVTNLESDATHAEKDVENVTSEIRWLDTAKRNVATSIVMLKRLQMLVSSTFHLEQLCEAEQFREAASTLQAVEALLENFGSASAVDLVLEQRRRVEGLRADLKQKAMQQYEQAFTQSRARWDANTTRLSDAALVIDALGQETRTALIDWYSARQLREYRRIFRAVDEAGQLDNVARRYAWIRRILRTLDDEHSAAFLPHWQVDQRLVSLFAEITRDDLKSVLVRSQAQLDADLLLDALNATKEFEAQVSKKYHQPFQEVVSAQRTATAVPNELTISSSFTPYLHLFVDAQEKRLASLFEQFNQHTGQAPAGSFEAQVASHSEEPMKVLLSSTELFWFYRQTFERCGQLGEQAPFRELGLLFAKWLRRYVYQILQPTLLPRAQDVDAHVRKLCTTLNTADYCATTCTQLEQKLNPAFTAQDSPISLEKERQGFFGIIAAALQHLSRALYNHTESGFQQMLRPEVPWAQLDYVMDKSPYIDTLASVMEQIAVIVRHEVENKRFVRSWCDKAVGTVTIRFQHTLLRLRPVRQNVAKQLLNDVQHLQELLQGLPHFGSQTWAGVPNAHTMQTSHQRLVQKTFSRITPILAILASLPDDSLEISEAVTMYRAEIQDQSLQNFQKILDLKGIKRMDQTPFIEEFLAAIDREAEPLPTTSVLSGWSIDPNADMYAPPDLPGERQVSREDSRDLDSLASAASQPTSSSLAQSAATATSATSARLPDWMRFGNMLGAALGRSQKP